MSESMHEKMMRVHGATQGGKGGKRQLLSYEITLKRKSEIANDTCAFTFSKPKSFSFKAGQHIRMTLINPPETDSEGDSRFFSVASSPQDKDLLIAMRVRDTAFKRVLGNMNRGDKVKIQIMAHSMHESFTLHDDATKPAVFVVGGIGIVPAYSIIKDATERKLLHKIYLFYSNRRPEDATFLNELQQLVKKNPHFKLVATMTESDDWHGTTGRIDASMIKKYIKDTKKPTYYVAGLPAMVSSMKRLLADMGVSDGIIRAEEFTGFDLNAITSKTANKRRSYAAIIVIAIVVIAMILVHTGIAVALFKGMGSSSFNSPLLYIVIGIFFGVLMSFKVRYLLKFVLRGK